MMLGNVGYINFLSLVTLLVIGSTVNFCFADEKQTQQTSPSTTEKSASGNRQFAVVDTKVITEQEYLFALEKGVRERFFHGKVAKKEMDEFKQAIADKLIDHVLLNQEAQRRKVVIKKEEQDRLERKIEKYEKRASSQPDWPDKRENVLGLLRQQLEREALVKALETSVKDVAEPSKEEKLVYYEKFPDKFTAPEEWHVSIILLKVDPSSPSLVWQDTTDFAIDLVDQLRDGADFEEAAYVHSGDESAMDGGDMGYIHIGMLAKPAQDVLNLMDLDQISEPVFLLQGVAIFRLNGIKGSRLNNYERVEERLTALLKRQNGLDLWEKLKKDLKAKAKLTVNNDVIKTALANNY